MPTVKRVFITQPENLRTIRPVMWREIEKYCKPEFASIDLCIPASDDDCNDDFYKELSDKLQAFEVENRSSKLTDVLVGLDEFSSAQGEEFPNTLHAIAEATGVENDFLKRYGISEEEELSDIELAVLLMLDARSKKQFQGFRSCLAVDKATFDYFDCVFEGDIYDFVKPSDADIVSLATKYKENENYRKALKIKDDGYCTINMVERQAYIINEEGEPEIVEEWWFNINRPNRPVVSASIKGQDISNISYVPPTTDVVIVNKVTKQLRTNTTSSARRNIYLKTILELVCPGDGVSFVQADTYTFAELEKEGWQSLFNNGGIDGLNTVRLKQVDQFAQLDGAGMIVKVKSLPRRSLSLFPRQEKYEPGDIRNIEKFSGVTLIVLEFVFSGEASTPTVVRIPAGNRISIKRKQNAPEVLLWLRKQRFTVTKTPLLEALDEE